MLEGQSSGSVSDWGGDGLSQRPVTALGRGIDGEISLPIGRPQEEGGRGCRGGGPGCGRFGDALESWTERDKISDVV